MSKSTIPQMTYAERQARAAAKRKMLLRFLASGEVFTTVAISARLLSISDTSAERTLNALVRDGALKTEKHIIECRTTNIYGISPHGLAMADMFEPRPFFELGRTAPNYIPHHLETQMARLAAEAAGFTKWLPGKTLHNTGLMKIPDAICTSPAGRRVAIEIERFIKTPKRYAEVISAHLQSIAQKEWDEVVYLSPNQLHVKIEKAFKKIEFVSVSGEKVQLDQRHYARFKFFDLGQWPNNQKEEA